MSARPKRSPSDDVETLREATTKNRLLEAAARVIARQGYDRATLDAVAAEAGLTKGAVYWHFSGKQELLLAVLTAFAAAQQEALDASLAEPELSAEAILLHAAPLVLGLGSQESARLGLELVVQGRLPAVLEPLTAARRTRELALSRALAARQEANDGNAEAQAAALLALADGLVQARALGAVEEAERAQTAAQRLLGARSKRARQR